MRRILTAWESISELKVMVEVPSQSIDTLRERTDSCCTTSLVTFNSDFLKFLFYPKIIVGTSQILRKQEILREPLEV